MGINIGGLGEGKVNLTLSAFSFQVFTILSHGLTGQQISTISRNERLKKRKEIFVAHMFCSTPCFMHDEGENWAMSKGGGGGAYLRGGAYFI